MTRWAIGGMIALAAAVLFLSTPPEGQFWWSDAPRHALDGVFVKDFVADLPLGNPRQWAVDYYLQYPALTILFYPPGLSVVLAAAYAVFGTSQETALLVVALFDFALAAATALLLRRWLPPWQAAASGILVIATPEAALWGRQVMLEIPAYSFLVISAWAAFRYRDRGA